MPKGLVSSDIFYNRVEKITNIKSTAMVNDGKITEIYCLADGF